MLTLRKSRIVQMVPILIAISLVGLPAHAKYSGGRGEPNDPYQIATAADLIALGETPEDYDKHFILTADIDLDPNLPGRKVFDKAVIAADTNGVELGFQGNSFAGVFDGNAHTVSHLMIEIEGGGYLGLFGQLAPGAEVKNLGVLDVNIIASGNHVGGLVGSNGGTVTRCYSTGRVSSRENIGGLVGYNGGTVTDCYSTGAVSADSYAGGLAGTTSRTLTRCYSTGTVSGKDHIGGLVGASRGFGRPLPPVIANLCFWDMQTSGQATSAGGTGKTTAEMQTAATFFDWGICGNEGVWTIDEGNDYPRLAWENRHGEEIRLSPLSDLLLGTGTESDPFLVCTAEELCLIGLFPCEWDKHFKLMADIDLSAFDGNDGRPAFDVIGPGREYYTPSGPGFLGTPFTGVFDGNGHTISHLTVSTDGCAGLFGRVEGEVMNLGVVDVNITSSGSPVGSVAAWNYGTLVCCYSTGAVNGYGYVGGLVGYNGYGCAVTYCYSTCTVSGNESIGGLVGYNKGAVTQCYTTGAVSGNSSVGGLLGYNDYGTVTDCFWDIQSSGQATSAGGTGKTTTEMQNIQTYQEVGWDFVGEVRNGLHEIWQMPEGGGYPVLAILSGYIPVQLEGHGTPDSPYLIFDSLDLGAMIHYSPYAQYRLATPIDLSGIRWGISVIPSFCGIFDGNNLTISHLTIAGREFLGLFGRLGPGANISNLGLEAVEVSGTGNYVGGLVGSNHYASVTQCYSTGVVRGASCVGGLVGDNLYGNMINCYSTGFVTGNGSMGGLVGHNSYGSIATSYSTGAVNGTGGHVGGLVGHNSYGSIATSYSTGVVKGKSSTGGLVGETWRGNVTDCYSTGAVTGTSQVGGLVGYNWSSVIHCYSTGPVSGDDYRVGGLVGNNWGDVLACFWDTQTSGQTTSAGGTGKTTAEMQTASTFLVAGWDFVSETTNGTEDIWWILEGKDYPRLWWQAK